MRRGAPQLRLATAAALLALSGCTGRMSILAPPGGIQAERTQGLFIFFLAVTLTVFAVVMLFLLGAIVRGRSKGPGMPAPVVTPPKHAVDVPTEHPILAPSATEDRHLTRWVGGAVVLTVVILFVLLVSSYRTGTALASLLDEEALVVEVTGHQWWWEFRYLDGTPSQILIVANELHIPVGKPVQLKLSSSDVIHSFWVPRLQGKRDAIPGQTATEVIRADAPGEYEGTCAEFCGLQHAHMSFLVVAEPEDAFKKWKQAQLQPAPAPVTDQQKRGQQVFLTGPCAMCHTIGGTIAGATLGPPLTHLASQKRIAAGILPNTRGHVAGWISDPQSIKPGVRMPPNPFTPEDLHALLAYLESLK